MPVLTNAPEYPRNGQPLRAPVLELERQLDEITELVEILLQPAQAEFETETTTFESVIRTRLLNARGAATQLHQELRESEERSEALARAQADAIVHSAEIIDELDVTRERLAEAHQAADAAARDTRRLADTIFEGTHDAALVFRDRTCIACNDNAAVLFGVTRDHLLGTWPVPFEMSRLPDGNAAGPQLAALYDDAVKGSMSRLEILFFRDAESLSCEVTLSAFDMQAEEHVLVTVRDISDRKKLEEELKRHRDFLDSIINAVPDQLFVISSGHRLVIANDSFCRVIGTDRDKVLDRGMTELFRNPVAERLVNGGEGTDRDEIAVDGEGGRSNVYALRRSVIQNSLAGEAYLVTTARDITSERARERRLSLLASVFNSAAEGIAILTNDGRIREANPQFLKMFGRTIDEIQGWPIASTVNLQVPGFEDHLRRVAAGETWSSKCAVQTCPDESPQWFRIALSRSHQASNEIIALFADVTKLENSQQQLQYQALHDNLTSLPNRRCFRRLVDDLIEREEPFWICFLDLDDFKHVNDSLGHQAGDRLLKAVADRLLGCLGADSTLARFGGDEFAAILNRPETSPDDVAARIECILETLQQPFDLGESEVNVGVSIGVSRFPEFAQTAENLMRSADIALYAAKNAGKNQIRAFSPQMQADADHRYRIRRDLKRALTENRIKLEYQPKLSARTLTPSGCEALVRWQRDDDTLVRPGEFIPIAEQTGLIVPLGECVLREAALQCREWADQELDCFPVAVNISPQQLRLRDFVERTQAILKETGASPEWFEFEITENAVIDDVERVRETIDQLAGLGIRIAIDDFGTGFSSLSYLRDFRLHSLKIDSSFIHAVAQDDQSQAIVQSIVSLGRGLQLETVAEGVEDPDQARVLKTLGVDVLQGYLISKPLPARQFHQWLESCSPA